MVKQREIIEDNYTGELLIDRENSIPEEKNVEKETILIYFLLDNKNFITEWGTSTINKEEKILEVPLNHAIFLLGDFRSFFFDEKDKALYYEESKAVEDYKSIVLNRIIEEKKLERTIKYKEKIYPYEEIDKNKYQNFFNNYMLSSNDEKVILKTLSDEKIEMDKIEFLTFFAYIVEYEKYKDNLIDIYYRIKIQESSTISELDNLHWGDALEENYPLPEIPDIDSNQDGSISREEYDNILKENKSLKQQVDFNEKALLDAINMLSNMIME